ncbi:MAG: hypothetical protein ABSA02_41830 [Trebonia sp.]|jgi:hypothetical protein
MEPEQRQDAPEFAGARSRRRACRLAGRHRGVLPDAINGKALNGTITSFATVARELTEQVRAAAANTLRSVIARAAAP